MNSEQQIAFDKMKLLCESDYTKESKHNDPTAVLSRFQEIAFKYPEVVQEENEFLLQWACFCGSLKIAQYLVNIGGNVHVNDDACLNSACENGHLYVVDFLLKKGADLTNNGYECLRNACRKNHLDIVKHLITHGADVHANNDECLRTACKNGYLAMVEYLVEQGADIHAENELAIRNAFYFFDENRLPFNRYYTVCKENKKYYDHEQIIEFLIGKGSKIPVRTDRIACLRDSYLCTKMRAKLATLPTY